MQASICLQEDTTHRIALARGIAGMTGLLSVVLTWLRGTPEVVRNLALVVIGFIILDTVSGFVVAMMTGKVKSARMRAGLVAKMVQYACLMAIASGAGVLVQNWFPVECGLGAILSIEAVSILENMRGLERLGGINLGPARPFLRYIAKFLDAGESQQEQQENPPPHYLPRPDKDTSDKKERR